MEGKEFCVVYVMMEEEGRWVHQGALLECDANGQIPYQDIYVSIDAVFPPGSTFSNIRRLNSFDVMNGVPYIEELVEGGATYYLLRLPGMTDDQVATAKQQIREKCDVVRLYVYDIKPLTDWTPPPPMRIATELPSYIRLDGAIDAAP